MMVVNPAPLERRRPRLIHHCAAARLTGFAEVTRACPLENMLQYGVASRMMSSERRHWLIDLVSLSVFVVREREGM